MQQILHKADNLAQNPISGSIVGGGTATYGLLSDLATISEQIGMIAGALLTLCLLSHFIYKRYVDFRGWWRAIDR